MTIQVNKYSLTKYFKHLEVDTTKKTPCDMLELMEDDYYSTSNSKFIKYGDMDLVHFIRSNLKKIDDQETIIFRLSKENITIKRKLRNLLKGVK